MTKEASPLDAYLTQHGDLMKAKAGLEVPEVDLLKRLQALLNEPAFVSSVKQAIVLNDLLPGGSMVKLNLGNGLNILGQVDTVIRQQIAQSELNKPS